MRIVFVYMNNEQNVGRGAGYVAAAARRAGHAVDFYDTAYTPIDDLARTIIRGTYDVLLISTMTMIFPRAVELAQAVKRSRPLPILLGGIHPTIIGASLLREHACFDYLCIGEGESMVPEFLDRLQAGDVSGVPNLAYRRGDSVVANPVRPAEDLSRMPEFPWQDFPVKAIVQKPHGFCYVNASRGCPYNCTYCCNGKYLDLYRKEYLRFRPVDAVIRELRLLKERYKPRLFYFGDEMMLSKPAHAEELFGRIQREIGVPYGLMCRVEYLNEQGVRLLKETGCQYLGMGLECGDEEFRRKHLNRHMSNAQVEHAFALAKKAGIFATSFNMIGYPFEEDPVLTERTVKLNLKVRPDYCQVSIFYPFPGTKIYDHCVQNDLIDPDKLRRTTDYFSESVLRGVTLARKRDEIDRLLNPHGMSFRESYATRALRRASEIAGRLLRKTRGAG